MSFDPPASGSFPQAPPAPSLVGEVLDGRYRIFKKLGEGGMGEVYAAEHVHIEKRFAVKLLRPEIVSNAEAVKRFQQEARSSSSIKHRNIIAVEDFGRLPDGRIYMCMELLDGAPLNDMIQQPMGADRLLNILIQTGHGLAAAHAKGIVHRDMKPENIFVTHGGNSERRPEAARLRHREGRRQRRPEQPDPHRHDLRHAVLHGARAGARQSRRRAHRHLRDGRDHVRVLRRLAAVPGRVVHGHPHAAHHDASPSRSRSARRRRAARCRMGVAEIITRCMQKNPAQRFQTMDELVNALDRRSIAAIAGAGMSTYMEAFPVGSAQHMRAADAAADDRRAACGDGVSPTRRGTIAAVRPGQSQHVAPSGAERRRSAVSRALVRSERRRRRGPEEEQAPA